VNKYLLLAILAGIGAIGLATPASAQVIPSVRGVSSFSAQANFMSLSGYMRWQYFTENKVWISRAEAAALVSSQTRTARPGA